MTSVSVAICTRDRPEQLMRALKSLEAQTCAPTETLVIDNGYGDGPVRQIIREHFRDVRYVVEPRLGLDFARNAVLRIATGDIVAFLDDDAVADPEWLATLVARFAADAELAACMGRIAPLSLVEPGARVFEANGGFSGGSHPLTLPRDAREMRLRGRRAPLIAWVVSSGSGCNMAVRRRTALALGGFDEALDLGAALPGGGDHDMIWRLLGAGHSTGYEPNALVMHEHRPTEAGAYDQIIGHQRALVALLVKSALVKPAPTGAGHRKVEVLAFLAWRLVKPAVRFVRRALKRDPLPARVLARLWWNCWKGLFAYAGARRTAADRRRGISACSAVSVAA